jgi:uncharacterized protein (DUF305 family)
MSSKRLDMKRVLQMMRLSTAPSILSAVAALLLPLAACSNQPQTATTPTTTQADRHNQADSAFVIAMGKHHQQALDMAALVPQSSQNEEVTAIAAKIHDEQAPEIAKFGQLVKEFGAQAMPSTDMPEMSGSNTSMDGMVPDSAVEHLKTLNGSGFDKAWVGLMIEHHKGAVDMAQDELKNGENAEVKQIAQNIVTTQTAEIDQLGKLAAKLQTTN